MQDIRDQKYTETFEATVAQITMRRRVDKNFTLHELQKLLETAYINQGNEWGGKGSLQEIVQEATIAAYEFLLAEWQENDVEQPLLSARKK